MPTLSSNKLSQVDYTDGHVLKNILRMGVPSAIGFMSLNLYDFVNAIWVARLGSEHVAAITLFFGFYWVISSVNQLAGTGSVAVISQNFGNRDLDRTEAAIKETLIFKWLLALFFGVLGFLFLKRVLMWLGASAAPIGGSSESVLSLALKYGHVQLLGLGFAFCSFTNYTSLRGIGNPNQAMILQAASVGLNCLLDPFLIFGWGPFPALGIVGAAWASVTAYAASFLAGLYLFYSGKTNVKLHVKGRVPISARGIWKIFAIGAPSGVNSISFSLSRSVVLSFVAMTTTEAVAAYGIGLRVMALGYMGIVGLGLGLSALIGQILGAEKIDRARRTARQGILLALAFTVTMAAIIFVFDEPIMRLFFGHATGAAEAKVVEIGVVLLRILALSLPFTGAYLTMEMVFSGAGNNVPPMIFGLIHGWLLDIPFILIALKLLKVGEIGIWWSLTTSIAIGTLLFYWWYSKGHWLHKRVKGG